MSITVETAPTTTPNNHTNYSDWFPAQGNRFSFRVKTGNGAFIAFSTIKGHTEPMYELLIGAWGGKRTGIWKNPRGKWAINPELERQTVGVVSQAEFRGFWVDWEDNVIRLGHEAQRFPFLMYQIIEPFAINFIGIRSYTPGTWIIDKPRNIWIDAISGSVPEGALIGGEDRGTHVYVGRAQYEGNLIPGKVLAAHRGIYIPVNGTEVHLSNYQVLITHGPGVWIRTSGKHIPATSIVAGRDNGEDLYVGRVLHDGTLTPGKVHPSHRCCYISYDGKEMSFQHYEILIAES